jgi:ribosome-associated translation inhibitor RaiA
MMQLDTTYRHLTQSESSIATRALEKGYARFERLLDGPTTLRAVVEGGAESRVTLTLNIKGGEITSLSHGPDLNTVVSEACDKLKVQLVRRRHRREAQRRERVDTNVDETL